MKTFYKIIFLSAILLKAFIANAQQAVQNSLSPADYKSSLIELKKNFSPCSHKLVFIDERDDTTRMGFFVGNNKQYYFMFPKPAATYLQEKINTKKGEIAIDTLYIGIKRLWISQVHVPASLARSILLSSYSTISYCRIICNFYKRNGSNYSLVHVYDSIVSKSGYLGNIKDNLMQENLSAMKEVADSIGNTKNVKGISKYLLYPDTKAKNPIILSTEKPADGIYLTFRDFLNNMPVALDYTYEVSNNTEKIKLKEKRANDSIYTAQCWGFCKDNMPYMRVGTHFSRLTRIQNTYELRALESLQYKHGKKADAFWFGFNIASDIKQGMPLLLLFDLADQQKSPNTIIRIAPFKLDIETGEVY